MNKNTFLYRIFYFFLNDNTINKVDIQFFFYKITYLVNNIDIVIFSIKFMIPSTTILDSIVNVFLKKL